MQTNGLKSLLMLLGAVVVAGCNKGPEASLAVSPLARQLPASYHLKTVYQGSVLESFLQPDYRDKPMARMWFPDAGAGLDEFDTIGTQIKALAEGGFGGVEVTMLADGANFTNEQSRMVGWGTAAWRKLLKKVLTAANAVPGGFIVDITLSPHWPLIINTVDPNDAAAAQEISHATQKLAATQLSSGTLQLPLPKIRLKDGLTAAPAAPFIFTDTLVSSVLLKVASVDVQGKPQYDLNSLIDLTANTSAVAGEGYAAGVPDAAAAKQYGFDPGQVLELWGREPAAGADLSKSFNGKRDAEGNRARMKDWQSVYQADLSVVASQLKDYVPSAGAGLKAGDYVAVGIYRRGTGQVMSDGGFGGIAVLMHGRTYTTDYFSREGVDAVTHFWEQSILDDELRALLKTNKSSIFEDSIEAGASTAFWSHSLSDKFKASNYRYATQIPAVVALGATAFTDATLAGRIRTDFNNTLGKLYETEHLQPISQWAASFDYSYRAQARGVTGVDQYSSATIVDIPEGDNGTKGDGIRQLAGAARMSDKAYVSMEAVTGFGNLMLNWADVLTEVTQNFSHGVNHVVLHGTPYNKAWNGYMSDWTGWQAFGNNFAESYTYRQIYWEDVATLSGYMARNQAVLRNGIARVDVAVIGNGSGNSFQNLLDKGYSYHVVSEAMLHLKLATVSNARLNEAGPAYKALVVVGKVDDSVGGQDSIDPTGGPAGAGMAPANVAASFEDEPARTYSVASIQKLQSLAEAGLPVVLLNLDASTVSGTEAADNTDAALQAAVVKLKASRNVMLATTRAEVLSILGKAAIKPWAAYDQARLEATHYVDKGDGSDYYYLYNNSNPRNGGMLNVGVNSRYKTAEQAETEVTLTGKGVPYELNAWTGAVSPVASYHRNEDGTVTTRVNLHGGESTIIALLNTDLANVAAHVTDADGGAALYRDGALVFRSNAAGVHVVALSEGGKKSVEIAAALADLDLSAAQWDLELQSFGPDYRDSNKQGRIVADFDTPYTLYRDPSASLRTTVNFSGMSLANWSDLPASKQQLTTLGVKSMQNVSGIGRYSTTFALPAGWSSDTGAILKLGYSQDQVTEVTINGKTIDNVNVIADEVDLGGYLQAGPNTLTIKLATSLFNRALVESMVFKLPGRQVNGHKPMTYGLKSVVLSPYTQKML